MDVTVISVSVVRPSDSVVGICETKVVGSGIIRIVSNADAGVAEDMEDGADDELPIEETDMEVDCGGEVTDCKNEGGDVEFEDVLSSVGHDANRVAVGLVDVAEVVIMTGI